MCLSMEYVLSSRRHIRCSEDIEFKYPILLSEFLSVRDATEMFTLLVN